MSEELLLMGDADSVDRVWYPELRQKLGLPGNPTTKEEVICAPERFRRTKYIFSTWWMPEFSEREIAAYFPELKAVFYAAGTVRYFAEPFLKSGVRVFSAWKANAVPVAEFTVAQIVLAGKGYFRTARGLTDKGAYDRAKALFSHYHGNFGTTVGIIGCGAIGSLVAEKLRQYRLSVLAYDPFLSDERAEKLGVRKVSLAELFAESDVVTNHLANHAETAGLLGGALFGSLRPYATFINTGRGAQVKEDELVAVLRERQDLTALLDVTDPEPPEDSSGLYSLPNVFLSPHIAGSSGYECRRMAEYMADAYRQLENGQAPDGEVTEAILGTMA